MIGTEELSAKEKLKKARIKTYDKTPFFSYLVGHLTLVESENIPTAGVDYRGNLYYNEDFVDEMTYKEAQGVIIHEVLHLALQGKSRQGMRQDQLWNIAQDIVINYLVKKNGFELPVNDLVPDASNERIELGEPFDITIEELGDESFESVYDKVEDSIDEEDKKKVPSNMTLDEHDVGEDEDSGGGGEGDEEDEGNAISGEDVREEDEKDWGKIRDKAEAVAKQRGEMPAGMGEKISKSKESDVNYKKLISARLTSAIPYDFDYTRPHRRSSSLGYYIPSQRREGVELVVVLDTSGSISKDNLSEFLGEMRKMAESFEMVDMTVVQHDAEVQDVQEFDNVGKYDLSDFEFVGRGGTDHRPPLNHVDNEIRGNRKVVVCLTDGYTKIPQEYPSSFSDLIWVLNNHNVGEDTLHYGRIVRSRDFKN
jgi:predicted metal-dependent peptidase